MGRSSIDLYAREVGASFVDIQSFAAYVGGSPTNISVGARRLGLNTALLTAVGEDPVGDFILHFLDSEGVDTQYIPRKPNHRTSAVILGIEPPDRFPLVFYRDNCADNEMNIDDVLASPVNRCRIFEFAGTNLSKEPCRSATLFAAQCAREAGARVVFDIDFRPDQWHDARAFGQNVRAALPFVDIVLGTQDEINAANLSSVSQVSLTHQQVSDARVSGEIMESIEMLLSYGPEVVVEKRGREGARAHVSGAEPVDADGFPVKVYNILGAGDAFAAGFICGMNQGWSLHKSMRLGNACGAIVVTRHGCANFMPMLEEAMNFASDQGGL